MTSAPALRGLKFPLRLDQLKPGAKPAPGGSVAATSPGSSDVSTRSQTEAKGLRHGANRSRPPTRSQGLGMDSDEVRRQMVQRIGAEVRISPAVLKALATIPRHQFVDAALVTQAYEDTSLPIGHGQTISKPSVVARMIDLLMSGAGAIGAGGLGKVLEIGTGCGYQAAVLSLLARSVISVERLKPLHDKARELLAPLRSSKLRLVYGDGMFGHPPNAPYDSIIAAASGETLPMAWLEQLAIGGRLVSPICQEKTGRQMLVVVDRTERGYERQLHETVMFVPLKSGMSG